MSTYRAYRCHSEDGKVHARFDELPLEAPAAGEVVIRSAWSDINYKDALACTGAGKIMKRFPLTAGIDVAGHVHASADPRFKEGDAVLVVGCGLGEEYDGGYAEYVRAQGDWLVPLPAGLSLREAMAIGTAGFTAALAVVRMEDNGLQPELGPVLVTGATGGVGSLAIDMLAGRGYEVVALSGKRDAEGYLKGLGAARVLWRDELEMGTRPLEKALWAGAVDNLGGAVLAWLTRTVKPFCSIAAIGLAASPELHTTVMPFILRGVSLLGINSSYTPRPLRERAWARLAGDLKPRHLATITNREVPLAALPGVFEDYLRAQVLGRTVVRIGD
ncbi:MAG TPA: oxidoreductase [Candidatus Competibacteraceae bacterium]|nr:oxidoreductase [Candidatus Competibacteraceae bacterium]